MYQKLQIEGKKQKKALVENLGFKHTFSIFSHNFLQHAVEVVMLSTKIRKHKINTQESVNSVLRRLLS